MNWKSIGFKHLYIGLGVVISIALFNVIYSSITINQNKIFVEHIKEDIFPYLDKLNEFNLMVTESDILITSWVYLKYDEVDRTKLEKLHAQSYPQIKKDLLSLASSINRTSVAELDTLNHIFTQFEEVLSIHQEVMLSLSHDKSYEDPMIMLYTEEILEYEVFPAALEVNKGLTRVLNRNRAIANTLKDEMLHSFQNLLTTILLIGIALFGIISGLSIYIYRVITKPVLQVKNTLLVLSEGKLPTTRLEQTRDIVGDMVAAMNKLSLNLIITSNFAKEIGKGNLDAGFVPLSEEDVLGNSLINMKRSLQNYAQEMESKHEEMTVKNGALLEQSNTLQKQHDKIRDSIRYAKRIQNAILPSHENIALDLPNFFVIYKPKDIVSGDFYWFRRLRKNVVIAAADCTGHGVPGAFMTVMGSSILNQIIDDSFGRVSPARILTMLDRKVIQNLQKSKDGNSMNDGMDIGICLIDKEREQIRFAGAKRPLYIFHEDELTEIKGSKFPIGSSQFENKVFEDTTIPYEKGKRLYLTSDGYADQFGGENNMKFMRKQFKKLLQEIHKKPMAEQKAILLQKMEEWQGDLPQTDDWLIIGMEL